MYKLNQFYAHAWILQGTCVLPGHNFVCSTVTMYMYHNNYTSKFLPIPHQFSFFMPILSYIKDCTEDMVTLYPIYFTNTKVARLGKIFIQQKFHVQS